MLAPSPRPDYIIQTGDCRTLLRSYPPKSVNCCVTSPPYFGLRDYGIAEQIGLEKTPDAYVAEMVAVFREVHRVLRDDGTLWLNLGDSYANDSKWGGASGGKHAASLHGQTSIGRTKVQTGLPAKNLIGIPWRVAFALQDGGWILREDIIWNKPNAMPDPTKDRCTRAHEYIFHFSKSQSYYHDSEAIREPISEGQVGRLRKDPVGGKSHKERGQHSAGGVYDTTKQRNHENRKYVGFNERFADAEYPETRNKRSVWTINSKPFKEAHFATFPPALIEPCVLAGCPPNGIVLDPFGGAGTTALVALQHKRRAILIELNPAYATMADKRIRDAQ